MTITVSINVYHNNKLNCICRRRYKLQTSNFRINELLIKEFKLSTNSTAAHIEQHILLNHLLILIIMSMNIITNKY